MLLECYLHLLVKHPQWQPTLSCTPLTLFYLWENSTSLQAETPTPLSPCHRQCNRRGMQHGHLHTCAHRKQTSVLLFHMHTETQARPKLFSANLNTTPLTAPPFTSSWKTRSMLAYSFCNCFLVLFISLIYIKTLLILEGRDQAWNCSVLLPTLSATNLPTVSTQWERNEGEIEANVGPSHNSSKGSAVFFDRKVEMCHLSLLRPTRWLSQPPASMRLRSGSTKRGLCTCQATELND